MSSTSPCRRQSPSTPGLARGQGARVLLVEDDPDLLTELAGVLRRSGYVVAATTDPLEAVMLASGDEPIQVVITDVNMPDLDGLGLLGLLKGRLGDASGTQFIVITGVPSIDGAVTSMRLGVGEFLTKPFGSKVLLDAVATAADKARRLSSRHSRPAPHNPALEEIRTLVPRPPASEDGKEDLDSVVAGYVDLIGQLIGTRGQRAAMFADPVFEEPVWDMLLELSLARLTGERLTVSQLCRRSRAAKTTAFRQLERLERSGLVGRQVDPGNTRRRIVEITDAALRQLLEYLEQVDHAPEA